MSHTELREVGCEDSHRARLGQLKAEFPEYFRTRWDDTLLVATLWLEQFVF
jgi:hypothetical protein